MRFSLSIEVNKSLEHKIEFIMIQNESLTEYTTGNEICQLLFKCKHENDIHEHEKQ